MVDALRGSVDDCFLRIARKERDADVVRQQEQSVLISADRGRKTVDASYDRFHLSRRIMPLCETVCLGAEHQAGEDESGKPLPGRPCGQHAGKQSNIEPRHIVVAPAFTIESRRRKAQCGRGEVQQRRTKEHQHEGVVRARDPPA